MSYGLSPTGKVLKASWYGVPNKTYLLQYSTDLVHWEYAPQIQTGTGETLRYGFDVTKKANLFIKQVSTDENTADAELADFDQDGVSNIVELQQGSDPFGPSPDQGAPANPLKESIQSKFLSSNLPTQKLSNGQILTNTPSGTTTVVLSGNAVGEISNEGIVWGGGIPGNYRGLLSSPGPMATGRSVITSFMINGQGDVTGVMGFGANDLRGLVGADGMSMTFQRTADNKYNRLVSNSGSSGQWIEMTQTITPNTDYRMMVRKESDGFSTWIQGGMFADMGAKVNSAVWFPISRWKGINPTASNMRAGIHNSWAGYTRNSEFTDVSNPAMDATSALLDYERGKNGIHVPSLLMLPGGQILAVWQNSVNHEATDCVIRMAMRNSRGVWGPSTTVIPAQADGAPNIGPVLSQVGDQVWLTYFTLANGIYTIKRQQVLVTDNGVTLSGNPVKLFNNGLLLNHILTLPNGRIVACWHTQSSIWKNLISYSDDGGTTWKSANMPQFNSRAGEGFAILEADGTLASYWRTDRGAIYRSTSSDNGATWSALAPTAIPCANMPTQGLIGSRVCGYKRASDGKIVIVGNNSTTQREKLTAWLINNGTIEGTQSLLPWDVTDGSAEGIHYPDVVVEADDSMTVIAARWQGGAVGSAELHSAINTFRVKPDFK